MTHTEKLLSKEKIENALKYLNGKIDTPSIKRTFASLFKDASYAIYANIHGYDDNEDLLSESLGWLFDLVVVQESASEIAGQQKYLTNIVLAMESEISDNFNGVMYDFQKLLISNAEYKAMVFRCHSSELESYFEYMKKNINAYKVANGNFFLIGYLNDGGSFIVREETVDRQMA